MAAGHPASAAAGAAALRAGGNAVDAAVAAVLTSFVAEPLLTGLGAGGYMLVAPPGQRPLLLDFFVETPGRGADARPAPMTDVLVTFEGTTQVFQIGASSCATYGVPAGVAAAAEQFGRMPLAELTAPAARLARTGVRVNAMQAYVFELLVDVVGSTPEAAARFTVDGRPPREGELLRDPELADALDRLGAEGAAPFYTGDIGCAVADRVCAGGGVLTRADLEAYRVVRRNPLCVTYGGRQVFTNPPPSAGGSRLVGALAHLETTGHAPDAPGIAAALEAGVRNGPAPGDALGSTTHTSVLDAEGWACSVTCSNGTGSGVTVPGTGVHLNNMLGEHDLFVPDGVGERLSSAMAPTVVRRDGTTELVLGSAGSSRIRSALLQVLVNVLDRGDSPQRAVDAPRIHVERGTAYAEPGIDAVALEAAAYPVTRFAAPNLFFGGCQAVRRDPATGALDGGADARRCGAVVVV
ncbi:gamma-glutamyltransferase [Pseudonocardia hierapolitana]|uniref:Gamma-glutamyltransferase n=1 Tax=Pseudonocardia hierapolitana TaxID=1128676 RepID=A0A561SZ61_9PSEU|nr:gamma-glutamyltransferase [Pseudonocardia hierapolitana]